MGQHSRVMLGNAYGIQLLAAQKNGWTICCTYISELILSSKNIGLIILSVLTLHHIPV